MKAMAGDTIVRMALPEDIQPDKEWIVTAVDGLPAKKLSGSHRFAVQIPKNQGLTIIHGKARKPDHPENTVCFITADVNDITKKEHYWSHLRTFLRCCELAPEPPETA